MLPPNGKTRRGGAVLENIDPDFIHGAGSGRKGGKVLARCAPEGKRQQLTAALHEELCIGHENQLYAKIKPFCGVQLDLNWSEAQPGGSAPVFNVGDALSLDPACSLTPGSLPGSPWRSRWAH